jgi:hypothetical protein
MSFSSTTTHSACSIRIPSFLFSLLFVLLLVGCGSKGVKLEGSVPGTGEGIASLTTGDGGTCTSAPCTSGDWNDSFITPNAPLTPNGANAFTVAMKSAMLIKKGDTAPSYTIFDTGDISKPVIQAFLPGTTQTLGINPDFPADGTYDRIQYVVSYYEMAIPINYQNTGSTQRRVRLYLGTFNDQTLGSVFQNDLLIDDPSGSLKWIDPNAGLGTFISPRPSTPNLALQVSAAQLDVDVPLMGSINTSASAFTDGNVAPVPLPYLIAQLSTSLAASETTTFTINYTDQDGNLATAPPFTIDSNTLPNTDIIVPLAAGHTRIQDITSIMNSPTTATAATVQFSGIGGVDTPLTDPYTFTFPLNTPLGVSGSPDNQFVIRLTFDTTKIFFFDSTNRDSSGDAPTSNTNFKPPLVHCTTNGSGFTNVACDGRLDANPPANFWPGLPAVTAGL